MVEARSVNVKNNTTTTDFSLNKRWASPRHYTVDSRLLPVGNPFKYHVVALYLQPVNLCNVHYYYHVCVMVYYIVSGLFLMFFWCMLSASGNLFKCHEEVLYLQPPLIPPKRFDIFSP